MQADRLTPNPGMPIVVSDMAEITDSLGDLVYRFANKTIMITGANGMLTEAI